MRKRSCLASARWLLFAFLESGSIVYKQEVLLI